MSAADGPDTVTAAGEASPPIARTPLSGRMLDRYTILDQVGAGGMGEVYAAYDAKLDRKVALKVLRKSSPEFETRLVREAQAMARLSHPNVVGVFDTGHVDNELYLAMEFVRGKTLRSWQEAAPRAFLDILRVYGEAGRGLAAAHAAGLVHRDFKPDNVLVAEDGRVKVTDFGLARAQEGQNPVLITGGAKQLARLRASKDTSGETPSPSSSGESLSSSCSLDAPMTLDGTLLGTPGYMAPEQLLCEAVDARTDQFSFCVSLYEAVYGERPFGKASRKGKRPSFEECAIATLEGKVNEAPKGTSVPPHVRRVLLRGLAPVREQRYPSLGELLADLSRDPAKKRRQMLAAAFAAATLAASVTVGVVQTRRAAVGRALVCKGSEDALRGVWDAPKKEQMKQAFLATRSPLAEDTWQRVERALDDYAAGWVTMRTEACEATRVRGLQSDEAMTLRMACLDRRRDGLKAYGDAFSNPDKEAVEHAVKAALAMTPLDGCADLSTLRMAMPPPEDPVARAKVDALSPKVAELKVLYDKGQYKDAILRAAPAIQEADATGYPPIVAELRFWSASAYSGTGNYKEAERESLNALWAAEEAGHHEMAVRASTVLAFSLGHLSREAEAVRWAEHGKALLKHMHGNLELEGALELAINAATYLREPAEGLRHAERARELWEKALSPNHPELGKVYGALGIDYTVLGDFEKANAYFARAVEHGEKALGSEHPALHQPLGNLGVALYELGRYDEAEPYLARCVRLEGVVGVMRAVALAALAGIHEPRGQRERALAELDLAEREVERNVGEHPRFTADVLFYKSSTLSSLGRHSEAVAAAKRALVLREANFDAKSPARAEAENVYGSALRASGKPLEALVHHDRASKVWNEASHPDAASAESGLGHDHLDLGHFDQAARHFERAIAIKEKASGTDHPALADMLTGLGRAQLGLGDAARAQPNLARAVAIAEKARLAPPVLSEARFALAQALEAGGSHDAARQLAAVAHKDATLAGQERQAKRIDAWLAAHP